MFQIIKRHGKQIYAYQLGTENPVLQELMAQGKLKELGDGSYAVLSRETVETGGQIAARGDYVKIDGGGYPYPNDAQWFQENHRAIEGNLYEQIPKALWAWTIDEPVCDEIRFLKQYKGLSIDTDSFDHCFTAPLWGTVETAKRDDIVVFYQIVRNADGTLTDIDFNFVAREEFQRTYRLYETQ